MYGTVHVHVVTQYILLPCLCSFPLFPVFRAIVQREHLQRYTHSCISYIRPPHAIVIACTRKTLPVVGPEMVWKIRGGVIQIIQCRIQPVQLLGKCSCYPLIRSLDFFFCNPPIAVKRSSEYIKSTDILLCMRLFCK